MDENVTIINLSTVAESGTWDLQLESQKDEEKKFNIKRRVARLSTY